MNRAARWSALAALLVLTIVGFAVRSGDRSSTPTSFGTGRSGYRAVFTLLAELGVPVSRSYAAAADLPAGATVWWIDPLDLCSGGGALSAADDAGTWAPLGWVARGGTGVLLFSPRQPSPACELSDDVLLPARQATAVKPPATQMVSGPMAIEPRALENGSLETFDPAPSWNVLATVDDRPFVVERTLGHGRLFAVADASFLRNDWLDRGDAAPLAVDLVRVAGAPLLDERSHGFDVEGSALRYLAGSSALLVFLGLVLAGALLAWRGHAMPVRGLPPPDESAPVLETFVDSLAALYARTHDYRRVLERYRELSLGRLRRHFGLPPDTATAVLVERLRRDRHLSPDLLRHLTDEPRAASEGSLYETARGLDDLVREATR